MSYAKLVDGHIQYAPRAVMRGQTYHNPYPVELLLADGYVPAEELAPPDTAGEIAGLKGRLAETDYQIIKCSEHQLVGLELPYDLVKLHAQRQALRDEINRLESGAAEP